MAGPNKYDSIPPGTLLPRTQVPEGPPGLLSRFFNKFGPAVSQVFGGVDDPRLSPEENQRARRQAMIQSGLATIMAANQSGATALGSVAAGAMHGQQAGGALREQTYGQGIDVNRRRMYEELVKGGEVDVPMLRRLFTQAIASGDTEGAKAISQVLQVADGSSGGLDTGSYMVQGEGVNPQTGKVEKYLMDRRTGETKWTGIQPAPSSSSTSLQVKDGVNPETGKVEQYAFNPATGDIRWLGVPPAPTGTGSNGVELQRAFSRENAMADDYRAETKPIEDAYLLVQNAIDRSNEAIHGDGAAKVAVLYGFIRAMDPNSVVREGEIRLARAAAPLWQRANALYEDVTAGKSPAVPREMVEQMVQYMRFMQAEKEALWGEIRDNFLERGKQWGVDENVFRKPPARYKPLSGDPFGDLGGR